MLKTLWLSCRGRYAHLRPNEALPIEKRERSRERCSSGTVLALIRGHILLFNA